jgi:hypothetical protein
MLEETGFSGVEHAGIRLARKAQLQRHPPVAISPGGSKAVIYFGAARKA